MMLKKLQLFLHNAYPQIKRVLFALSVVILLLFSMITIANQNRLLTKQGELLDQAKSLAQQNNALSKENRRLNRESRDYAAASLRHIDCNFRAFAAFTQSFKPVEVIDLDKCVITLSDGTTLGATGSLSTSGASAGGTQVAPQGSSPASAVQGRSSSPQFAPINPSTQPNNVQPSVQQPVLNVPLPCIDIGLVKVC